MPSPIHTSIAVLCLLFVLPQTASADADGNGTLTIPVGQFGLVLDDGTRIVGVPSKEWSATLKTRFGEVTIPRRKWSSIEFLVDGALVVLKNGDRVTGKFTPPRMVFDTSYGRLSFPMSAIVRLTAQEAPQRRMTSSTLQAMMPKLKGKWVVTYTNKTRQVRTIRADRLVPEGARLVHRNGDLLLEFQTVIERITFVDNKLFVEHYNPGFIYPGGIPTVMGVGRKMSSR